MQVSNDDLDILDTIYSCAAGQMEWPSFLKEFNARFPSLKPAIAGYDSQFAGLNLWLIEGIPDDFVEAYAKYYYRLNPWAEIIERLPMAPHVEWGHDHISTEEIKRTEFYNDFVRPLDDAVLGFGTMLAREPGRFLSFHANTGLAHAEEGQRAVDCMKRLGPHLSRAFELYRHLGDVELYANALEDCLNQLASAVFVVDGDQRLQFANEAANALLTQGTVVRISAPGGLRFCALEDERTVTHQIKSLDNGNGGTTSGYFRLHLPLGRPLVGFLSRLRLDEERYVRRPGRIIAPRRLYILFLIDPGQRVGAEEEALRAVLGLTRAEAQLARSLLAGLSLQQHAQRAGISYHTARSHAKALLAKTETKSQAELVQMLTKIFRA